MNKELLALSRLVVHHWIYLQFLGEKNEDRKESDYGASGEMKSKKKQAQDEKANNIVRQLLPLQFFRHFDPVFPTVTVPDGHSTQEFCASWSWYWSSGHARQSLSVK